MVKTFSSLRYGERIGFVVMLCGIVFLAIVASVFVIRIAHGANPFAIRFPVSELGNCGSIEECRAYCDDAKNSEACAAFAESRGLASKKEVEQARTLSSGGPGGCEGAAACKSYCDDPAHGEECLNFAEKNGFISKGDAQRARQMLNKTGPGGCRGSECQRYCEDATHIDECVDFAEREGFMSKEEAGRAKKFKALANEAGPGGCRGEGECRNYCDDPAHLEECLDFGVKKGFMSAEEAARIRKISGNGPGGCKNKRECDVYCQAQEHGEECIAFAVENGFMPKEEAERVRQMMNKTGPGGCRGEACRTYCDDPAHQEECIDFAVKEGMMPKEEAERAKKFAQATKEAGPGGCKGQQECGKYCGDPAHGEECFTFAKANGLVRPEEERRHEQSRGLNQKIQENGGPGGCKDESECMQYCGDPSHVSECIDFAEKSGAMSREEAQSGLERFQEHREFGERVRAAGPEQFGPGGGFQGGPRFGPGPGSGGFGPRGPGGSGFGPPPGGPGMPGGFGPGQSGGFGSPAGGFGPAFGGQQEFAGQGGPPAGGFAGPGGCASPEECVDFCAKPENRGACVDIFRRGMQPPSVEIRPPEFRGPGGCRGFEECGNYCQDPSHDEECKRYATPQGITPQVPQAGMQPQGAPMAPGTPFPQVPMEGGGAFPPAGMPQGPGDSQFMSVPGVQFPGNIPPCQTPEECQILEEKKRAGLIPPPPRFSPDAERHDGGGDPGVNRLPSPGPQPPQGDGFFQRFRGFFGGEGQNPPQGELRAPMPPAPMPRADGGVLEGGGEFRGQPGEFPGRPEVFPARQGFGSGGQPGMRGAPFDGNGSLPSNTMRTQGVVGPEGYGQFAPNERPIAPPANMAPQEFLRRVEEGKIPMPQRDGFVQPDVVPRAPVVPTRTSESIPQPYEVAPMPVEVAPMQSRPVENFAPAPAPSGGRAAPMIEPAPAMAPAPMPVPENNFVPPPPPPPPPPTSRLKATSFIGLLYESLREILTR